MSPCPKGILANVCCFFIQKLFVKLKVNSSLIVDHYINELNLALYDNRQVLMNAVNGKTRSKFRTLDETLGSLFWP